MLPAPLLHSLQQLPNFDVPAFTAVHASGHQVTSIRLNDAKPLPNESVIMPLKQQSVTWCEQAFYLTSRPSFTLDPALHAGAYYVQEASSMFLWKVLATTVGNSIKNAKVLDVCAAPGGKSTLLASYFKDGCVVSNEVIKSRANILAENITKWGSDHVIVTSNDPSHFTALEGFFDVIVIDAPCSGSGLFRKDPDAINEWSEHNVALCQQRQQRILDDIIPCLKKDGILIYSTCSYSAEENETVADYIMQYPFASYEIPTSVNDKIVVTTSPQHKAFGYRFYPHLLDGEGLYMAAFKKMDGSSTAYYKEKKLTPLTKMEVENTKQLMEPWLGYTSFKQGEAIKLIPNELYASLLILSQILYIKKAGIEIGTFKGKDLIPHHELALSTLPLLHTASISLSLEDALQYLRRKEFNYNSTAIGWCLITWCGLRLGWAKVLPNRVNNYYPQEWRILKG